MSKLSEADIKSLHTILLGEKLSKPEISEVMQGVRTSKTNTLTYVTELILSAKFLRSTIKNAPALHLYFVHNTRLKLVSSLLPQADRIVDLGGANGSIYEMGYPHKFKEIIVVDLPPDERDPMYKDLDLMAQETPNGTIKVHFGDMSDLSFLKDNSVDMVWSGESIEHIDVEAGVRTISEAFRVLKPGGSFCLDTPNRLITEIHTAWNGGGFIHPEHKVEYYPKQLQDMLREGGFEIIEQRGVQEMPRTSATGQFDYSDYILGNALPASVEDSYMQYYRCQKPLPKARLTLRSFARRLKSALLSPR